ncbi:hypothetical protein FGIG_05220 [Fasciola gigantica]|uniref:Uncharacterized protein n=1 Tax=Fasciola gigantica TaxID=46835 RepID=A0A504YRM4_FASGI|nr:hypothetical protein FGIG_05220 [Fasciola gigantica]
MFQEPIVDIKIVSVRDNEEIPHGYHPIKRTHSGRFKANIKGRIGDEVYLCYRRGRDKPPITDIAMFTDSPSNRLLEDAKKITKTCGGKSANFRSSLIHPVYLSYRRAPKESGIDRLAVTDMCIIIPSKHETCPPAFNQVADSLNSNPLVNQMYLCFRKSLIKQYIIAYDPEVLFWYRVREPGVELKMTDREGLETSSQENTVPTNRLTHDSLDPDIRQVANFCLPWGAALESWSVEQEPPEPNFFTFVLTNESYQRLYGVAFTFYEPYDVSQLDMDKCYRLGVDPELLVSRKSQSSVLYEADAEEEARIREIQKHFFPARIGDRVVGVTKTMCLLSRWSFPVAFTNFLAFLYSRWQPAAKDDPIPFERYLSYFLCEVPFPSQSMPHVMVELCAAPILLNFPDDNDAVSKCEPFFFLLDCLGVDLTIQLLVQMLTEQKILLTSVRPFLLTQIGEALTAMIFPLRWTVVYIPFIYIGCIHVIQSPSPYLIGVDSRFFDFFRLPPGGGVTYVDLDTRNFKLPEPGCSGQPVLDAKSLPKATIGLQIKNTFMHFMAQLLKCYQRFLIPVRQAERDVLFNSSGFLKEIAEKHSRPFYVTLFETQQWANFVRDRSYVSARDEELSRFDSYMVRLFGDSADESPMGSQSLSDSPNSSLRGFGDRASEGCSQPGSANSAETVEEPRILKMLSSGSISNEAVHVVGPPKWPILGADPQLSVELSKRQNSDTDVRSSSVKLNEKLLDLFVSHAYSEHAPATIGFDALDATDSSTYLWRCQYASSRSDSSQNLANNARHLGNAKLELFGPVNDPLLVSLMTPDTPSPFISRSSLSMALSLTGLPTRYPLPVGGSVILRRSPLELHQTAEFGKLLIILSPSPLRAVFSTSSQIVIIEGSYFRQIVSTSDP